MTALTRLIYLAGEIAKKHRTIWKYVFFYVDEKISCKE